MKGNPLRNLLNRLIWDSRIKSGDYRIYYISRGARHDVDSVRGNKVVKVYSRGFEITAGGKIKYIPFHRVILVKNEVTGEIIYKKRTSR